MDSGFIDALKSLIDVKGKEILDDDSFGSLLKDFTCNRYEDDSGLLLKVLKFGVHRKIDTSQDLAICKKQQIQLLHKKGHLDKEMAADAVDTLALVLRGDKPEPELQSSDSGSGQPNTNAAVPSTNSNGNDAFERSKKYLANRDPNNAIKEINEAIQLNPDCEEYYCWRGYLWYFKGEYDLAIEDCTKAIRLNPTNAMAYNARGMAYHGKGQYDQAIRDITEAIKLDPADARGYVSRGTFYGMKDQYNQAISDFKKALALNPNDESAKEGLQRILEQSSASGSGQTNTNASIPSEFERLFGKPNSETQTFLDAVKKEFRKLQSGEEGTSTPSANSKGDDEFTRLFVRPNNNPNAQNMIMAKEAYNRSQRYGANYDFNNAIRELNEAIRLDPTYALAYAQRGNIYMAIGELYQAIIDSSEAIRLDPYNSFAYFTRGVAYFQQNQTYPAVADLKMALNIDPNNVAARTCLQNIGVF